MEPARLKMVSETQRWKRFTATYEAFSRSQRKSLDRLMRESDAWLGPKFSDPLRCDLMMQDVLSEAREEAYTAALGWSLGQLSIGQVVDILGIRDLTFPGSRWKQNKKWDYETEIDVPEGHTGRAGRVDMSITFQENLVAAIEVKTKEYSEHDAAKHRGYSKWADGQAGRVKAQLIFIAVRDLEIELHGFRFVNWADITAGLRKYARKVIEGKEYPIAATYLGFIGAVEQNLLGFGPPHGLTDAAAVRQTDHLRTVLQNKPK
jgi:hypothetical protein